MSVTLSVVVPIYNTEKYLRECLDSLIHQTFLDMEIILIDNKSTDSSGYICDEYQQKDRRIRVIHRKEHGWVSDARNDGINLALGKWITFVDSDDWLEIDCYEKVFEELNSREVDVFCEGGAYLDYPSISRKKPNGIGNFDFFIEEDLNFLMIHLFVPVHSEKDGRTFSLPWDKIYRLDFLRKNNLRYMEHILYLDDLYFNLQVFNKAARVAGGTYIGYHYRQMSNSIMNGYKPDCPNQIYHFLQEVDKEIGKTGKQEILKDAFYSKVIIAFWYMLRRYYFHRLNNMSYLSKVREIKEWKKRKIYKEAICRSSNDLLSSKFILVKQVLRIPFVFPVAVLVHYKNWSEKKHGKESFTNFSCW